MVTPNPTRDGVHSYGAIAVTGTPPWNLSAPAIAEVFKEAGGDLGQKVANTTRQAIYARGLSRAEL